MCLNTEIFFQKKIWTLTIKTRVLLPRLYGIYGNQCYCSVLDITLLSVYLCLIAYMYICVDEDETEDEDDEDEAEEIEDEWKTSVKARLEEEIARRVADALPETPPLERLKRRQLAAKRAAAAQLVVLYTNSSNQHFSIEIKSYSMRDLQMDCKFIFKGNIDNCVVTLA